ncbi:ubiquinol-cytochrome C reductase hinge domain-containing protein [Lipomyces tetrasporus]|uniref:Cytochrome b-c1 complex subunit 6, mitochondrial n=1 Tax=Lipomyces tetrasporus TaxID=54092 RepID=A0AAD7QTS0_9ASCO|nr:ubiquinol-cytochrome C reductase hinge domain-containing protein [Lipomyces tetrasporus]KAJ8101235.1 ubiquinol-cytochrome C reductase hinge domain-containing protein [Lipomyces tetrasporus]
MRNFVAEFFEAIVPSVKAEEPEEEGPIDEEGPVADEETLADAEPEDEVDEEAEEADDDDEEEEDEEPEDIMPKIQQKCANSSICHEYKHHFDECVERVTKAQEEPGYEDLEYKEDCVEEFFHLSHCVNDCTAPTLFRALK